MIGQVIAGPGGQPVPDATITLESFGGIARTDPNGYFELLAEPPTQLPEYYALVVHYRGTTKGFGFASYDPPNRRPVLLDMEQLPLEANCSVIPQPVGDSTSVGVFDVILRNFGPTRLETDMMYARLSTGPDVCEGSGLMSVNSFSDVIVVEPLRRIATGTMGGIPVVEEVQAWTSTDNNCLKVGFHSQKDIAPGDAIRIRLDVRSPELRAWLTLGRAAAKSPTGRAESLEC